MASEQMVRRENTTTDTAASEQTAGRENTTIEREIHIEKNRVPKMTTHFEHLAEEHAKESSDTPQGSIQELQGGEPRKEHAARAIGDTGGPGKARETHELGAHFESLADKVKGEREEKDRESHADKTSTTVPSSNVGKFEVEAEEKGSAGEARGRDQSELESRTRVVGMGKPMERGVGKERRENRGQVEVEKGRSLENRGETRSRGEAKEEEIRRGTENRGEIKGRVGHETQGPTAVITCTFEGGEKEETGSDTRKLEAGREIARREENRAKGGDQEKESQPTFEEIAKYRGQVQENTMEAIRAAQEKAMEKAAQAKDITLKKAAQAKDVTLEKAAQAKDVTLEKGQQGYATAKGNISSATKTASDYTTPVAEKARDYTSQAAEMAKSAGSTTAQYVGEKTVQAKDVTVETGKTAAEYAGKLAADLKDRATVAGWTAAHYSTEKTVEGTKAAANIVQGTTGYAASKASELASKSLGAVKGLAASAGETAKDFTARKREEAARELEAKRASQQQVERPSSKPTGQTFQTGHEQGQEGKGVFQTIAESFQGGGGGGGQPQTGARKDTKEGGGIGETIGQYAQAMIPTGETVRNIAQTVKKPLDSVTQGGSEVVGAVGETVGEIAETMIKPAEKASERAQEGEAGSGVLGAVRETIEEIAQTTKTMVVGDDEIESQSKQSIGSESRSTTNRGI